MLKDLGQVGLWLSSEGLEAAQLNEEQVAAFRIARQATGHRKVPGSRAMVPLLSYLREAGVARTGGKPLLTPLGGLVGQYRSCLVQERCLAPTTVLRYESTARRFRQEQESAGDELEPAALTGMDVNAFPQGMRSGVGRVGQGTGS